MKKIFFIICFLFYGSTLAQQLEEDIYVATETFNQSKSKGALNQLNTKIENFESLLTSKDEYYAFINLLVNKAFYLSKNNQPKSAISTYEKAWSLYKSQKIYEYDIVEFGLIPLGILYHTNKDYTNAENIIKQYSSIAKKNKNRIQRATGAINLAKVYQSLNKHNLAISIANQGLKIKDVRKNQYQKLKRIISHSEIKLKGTKIIYIDNGPIFRGVYSGSLEDYQTKYDIAFQNKDYAKALKAFYAIRHKTQNALTTPRTKSKLAFQEAQLYFLTNDNERALSTLKSAIGYLLPGYKGKNLPKTETLYAENTFIDIFDLLAELQTNPENKIACYDLSFFVEQLINEGLTAQDDKLINVSSNRSRSEKCIALLYELQQKSDSTIYIERAFSFAEKYKASVLKSSFDKKMLLKQHPNDSLLIEEQRLLNLLETLKNQLIKSPYQQNNFDKSVDLRERLNTTSIALKKLKTNINTKYPESIKTEINFNTLNKKLVKDNATLVEYFYGKHYIYQFTITETTASFNRINLTEDVKQNILNFIDYFNNASVINNNIQQFTTDAFSLYKTLQFDTLKEKNNIVIIPDGFLNFIPFDALLTAKTETTNYSKMPFVVVSHQLAYNSSASFYLQNRDRSNNNKLLGVFPVFKDTTKELSYSINEAKSIKKEMDASLLMNASATKSGFIDNASKYGVLHLSTHASSGTFSIPANIGFSDSTLFLNELYSLNLNPELVVLSACETGIGKLHRGEGAMSITRGFQYAGAQNILFSLWQISDLSTSQIMQSFYKNYDNNASAFVSNHNSKIEYLNTKNIKNIKKSPYYWSAFTYYGALDKPKKNTSSYYSIAGIFFLIVLLLLWLYKRQNGKRSARIPS